MSTLPRAHAPGGGVGGGRTRGAGGGRSRERPSSLYDNLPAPPPPPLPAADASSDGDSSSAAAPLPPLPPPPPPPPLASSTPAGRASRSLLAAAPETPSLLPALNTTVPVNVAARPADLAQRHAPTRSSLRHSRLVSKAYQQELDPQRPRAYRSRRLACALSGLELLLGLSVCMLALWLLLWAPRMRTRDVPYWSGAPLFLSGLCGLTLAGCPGDFPGSCIKFFRVVSIILAIQAALSCLVAAILSMMHLILLHWAQCEPESALSTSCECHTEMANILRYPDLSCPAVVNVLVLLLVGSCASNLMGCILAAWLLPLHWGRYRSHGYLPVASRPPS